MAPFLQPGDQVVVTALGQGCPLWGDLVLIEGQKQFMVHRYIGHFKGSFLTKGDANPSIDQARLRSELVAVVIQAQRGKKTFSRPQIRRQGWWPIIKAYGLMLRAYLRGGAKNVN